MESSCSICGSIHQLEVHHIVSRGMGGSSRPEIEAPENKILICRTCHTEITEHRWNLTRTTTELTVVSVSTGEVLVKRHYDPSFDPSAFFQRVNVLEADLESLLPGIPYLTDDQLVELFQQLRGVDKRTWKAQAAILYEAKQRSVYGDRAWEAMGRSFGVGWRQAYNLARVWQTFFTNDTGEFCNQLQNSPLEESHLVRRGLRDPDAPVLAALRRGPEGGRPQLLDRRLQGRGPPRRRRHGTGPQRQSSSPASAANGYACTAKSSIRSCARASVPAATSTRS